MNLLMEDLSVSLPFALLFNISKYIFKCGHVMRNDITTYKHDACMHTGIISHDKHLEGSSLLPLTLAGDIYKSETGPDFSDRKQRRFPGLSVHGSCPECLLKHSPRYPTSRVSSSAGSYGTCHLAFPTNSQVWKKKIAGQTTGTSWSDS